MKQKTHKATKKRYALTSTGKAKRRMAGQGHYNKRENGNDGRKKRKATFADKAQKRIIQMNLPN